MVSFEGAAAIRIGAPSPWAVTAAPASNAGTAATIAMNRRFTSYLLFRPGLHSLPAPCPFKRPFEPDLQFPYTRLLGKSLRAARYFDVMASDDERRAGLTDA